MRVVPNQARATAIATPDSVPSTENVPADAPPRGAGASAAGAALIRPPDKAVLPSPLAGSTRPAAPRLGRYQDGHNLFYIETLLSTIRPPITAKSVLDWKLTSNAWYK